MHALNDLLTSDSNIDKLIAKYFLIQYQQTIDGKKLCFGEFVSHIKVLRRVIKQFDITIDAITESANQIHTHRFVKNIKIDNATS
ncbi:hypothetical protein [Snodgrassella gandavensis]|uniref:hypothetical protein n=1 Tax=Snodgrassella gandavensis TaxID=2946698 RepID=UPI001EF5AAC7|nr:hypothetical protein [Snodgrassella gandavensis]